MVYAIVWSYLVNLMLLFLLKLVKGSLFAGDSAQGLTSLIRIYIMSMINIMK